MDQKLRFEQKIRYKQEFDQVFAARNRLSGKYFLAYFRSNSFSYSRIAIISAKRNVRLAVNRNRIRRQVKEWFRCNQGCLPSVDLVVVVKKGAGELVNEELRLCIEKVLKKLPGLAKG